MSYQGLLINTCDVVRPSIAEDHGTQTKTYDTESPVAENLICRIEFFSAQSSRSGGSLSPTIHGYETVEGWLGFFEYGANVLIDDLIVDERGREFILTTVPLDVTGIMHHIESQLALRE